MRRPWATLMRSQSGVALVSVLWVVILLTVIASTLIAMTTSHSKSMQAARARLEADQAGKAGIALALEALADPHGG